MRPPRFRLRTLLIAVAVVSAAAGMMALRRRSGRLAEVAATYRAAWQQHRDARDRGIPIFVMDDAGVPAPTRRLTDREADRWIEYYDARASRYERAARYPWLPVEPGPPPPE